MFCRSTRCLPLFLWSWTATCPKEEDVCSRTVLHGRFLFLVPRKKDKDLKHHIHMYRGEVSQQPGVALARTHANEISIGYVIANGTQDLVCETLPSSGVCLVALTLRGDFNARVDGYTRRPEFPSPVNRQERRSESAMPEKATACVTESSSTHRTFGQKLTGPGLSADQNAGAG